MRLSPRTDSIVDVRGSFVKVRGEKDGDVLD